MLDRLLEAAEDFLNHPVVAHALMIIAALILGLLVFAPSLAGVRL